MTRLKATAFPELRRVFTGYLHEDFAEEHGTPENALAAFYADANAAERRRFTHETEQLLALTASVAFAEVQVLIEHLGSRWIPASRDALVKWLNSGLDR